MPKFRGLLFLLLLSVGAAAPVDLLDRSSGPAGLATGGAGTARTGLISSPYWNPAGLVYNTKSGFEFTYYQNMGLVNHTSLDGVILLNRDTPPIALNFVQESLNSIPKTSEFNGQPQKSGSFADEYRFINLATALPLSSGMTGGINYKIISRSIADYGASGFAADVGLLQMFTPDLYAGLTFRNLFSALEWDTGLKEYYARRLTGGLAVQYRILDKTAWFFADLDIFNEDIPEWGAGAEIWLVEPVFCLRGGLNSKEEITLGSELRYYDFHCNFALLLRPPENQLNNTFLFGVGFDFQLAAETPQSGSGQAADFQPKISVANGLLIVSGLDTARLQEIALLNPQYDVRQLPLGETISAPVGTGNYTLFFQLKDGRIVRRNVTVK